MHKVPEYWWDFEGDSKVIVESNDDKFPIVATFRYDPSDGLGAAHLAIQQAEKLIDDLRAGRANPRNPE